MRKHICSKRQTRGLCECEVIWWPLMPLTLTIRFSKWKIKSSIWVSSSWNIYISMTFLWAKVFPPFYSYLILRIFLAIGFGNLQAFGLELRVFESNGRTLGRPATRICIELEPKSLSRRWLVTIEFCDKLFTTL